MDDHVRYLSLKLPCAVRACYKSLWVAGLVRAGDFIAVAFFSALCLSCGCLGKPSRVDLPSVNSAVVAKAAMERYDKNKDGKISGEELQNVPSFRLALRRLDSDGDGAVSADEIAARIEKWRETRIGLTPVQCTVFFRGRPLAGATVTFEPEEFQGDGIKACVGTTCQRGTAYLSIPDSETKLPGGAPGFYKIKVTSENVQIPDKYNTNTILGTEIAVDSTTPERGRGVVLKLEE